MDPRRMPQWVANIPSGRGEVTDVAMLRILLGIKVASGRGDVRHQGSAFSQLAVLGVAPRRGLWCVIRKGERQ